MKVLFVCSGNSWAGISPFIRAQGESLRNAGIGLDYFAIEGRGLKGYIKAAWKLRKHLRKKKYDIVHAHYGVSAFSALLAKRKEKLVVSFMGDDIIGANRPDGSMTISGNLVASLNAFFAERFYDHVIVKSEEMRGRLKIGNCSLIPNGVDIDRFQAKNKAQARSQLQIPMDRKLLIFVSDPGRVEKNFSLAKAAVQGLANSRIMLLPVFNKPQEILPDYYSAADVLLLTSFHEGSPNVIKEAMACNCPIISTDVGDVTWVLGNTEGCYLTSFAVDDLTEKIKMATVYTEKKDRTNGRERILKLGLDSATIAGKIVDVYKKVSN